MASIFGLQTGVPAAHAADPFAENVRTTDPLTPQEQAGTFKLPPGFEIELVTSEPDIAKPMNMAFDAKGRLWVTTSLEYPFPVTPPDKGGRDSIKIFEDTNGDGKYDKVSTFVDGLNIPIGIYPYKDGVIAWSIPNIWHFRDTDGDGKADQRDVLYGPLGWERDTHGNNASFRRGFDGWLYATHGFNNQTTIRGRDGSQINMQSGNTYRIRLDGSRVEQHTFGQVNPFGLCFDPSGNIYSADCHSSPIYQLLQGGYYPSFGKPDDGLGFAPVLMQHSHGSTAISGILYYSGDDWPAEYRGNILIGNVMTSRINRDQTIFSGSSPTAKEMPDFMTTTDPWFRPVDIQLGPDGALYVADFYNRIIGHYEVPLQHPGRDRERGRIWKISYKGDQGGKAPARPFNIVRASAQQLVDELANSNLTRRMLAMSELTDRVGDEALPALGAMLASSQTPAIQRAHGLWVVARLGGFFAGEGGILSSGISVDGQRRTGADLLAAAATDKEALVRVHAMRILAQVPNLHWLRGTVVAALNDPDALVRRCAAEALGAHPTAADADVLLEALNKVPDEDTHLRYVMRKALRDVLKSGNNFAEFRKKSLSENDTRQVAGLAVSIPSTEASSFLLKYIRTAREPQEQLTHYLRHAVRYLPESDLGTLAAIAQERFGKDLDLQLSLFKATQEGLVQRGTAATQPVREWGVRLAEWILDSPEGSGHSWSYHPVEGIGSAANPWFLQERKSADGNENAVFLCSLPPGGEQLTGTLRSPHFAVPSQLGFFVAGHDGYPDKPAQKKNVIRLRAADSGDVLAEVYPPRNDMAQPVKWDLARHAGRKAYLEITDADTGNAYAWLAVGRFQPEVVALPASSPNRVAERQKAAADLTRLLALTQFDSKLAKLLVADSTEWAVRPAIADALLAGKPDRSLSALAAILNDPAAPESVRVQVCQAIAKRDGSDAGAVLTEALRQSPYRIQVKIASNLAGSPEGAAQLLDLVEKRAAAPRLLLERSVKDKLVATKSESLAQRMETQTKGLSGLNADIQKLIDERRNGFASAKADLQNGQKLFTQACAICHQLGGSGKLIGPQLDGVGNRGLERILEDILDPNRNVDHAFRTSVITLKDGETISGLPRREEGEVLILANSGGAEISIAKKDIQARLESDSSLMPENFGEALSAQDLNDLLAFLLSKRQ